MNVLDLFSGIGGFSLGLERAGMRTVAFCERDEWCRAVLRKHWPEVPCFDDIHGIDAGGLDRLGRIDLVCGGFPCQPFSTAGKQEAQNDDRFLWPEMRRVIALARPAYVIGENVAGIISLALDDVLADLEGLRYAPRTFVVPACAVGARHRRDRVWIIAADARGNGLQGLSPGGDPESQAADDARSQAPGISSEDDTDSLRRQRSQRGTARRMGGGEPISRNGAWTVTSEPLVRRGAHGIPRRMDRLRALGNAVVPQVVEEIGRAIMQQVISGAQAVE